MPLDPKLLAILCCPATLDEWDANAQDGAQAQRRGQSCHGELAERPEGLLCLKCGRLYPVEEGIPVLLPDEARRTS